jgi:phosphatidylglycerophosphate synthase
MPARTSAKAKTFTQALAVGFALLPLLDSQRWVANSFLWLSVALAWISGIQYLVDHRKGAAGAV